MRSPASFALGAASLIALLGSAGSAEAKGHAKTASAPAERPALVPTPLVMPAPISHASQTVPFAQLPQGELLDQRWEKQPAAIPAGAKVAGVKVERSVNRYAGQSQINIEVTDANVDESARTGDDPPRADALCFGTASIDAYRDERRKHEAMRRRGAKVPAEGSDEPDAIPRQRWDASLSAQTAISRGQDGRGEFPQQDRVQQLHVEQLVTSAQGAALDSRDVWVDAMTGGARVRATAHLPLRDLGASPTGLHLYAGRSGDEVIFVASQTASSQNLFVERKDEGAQMTNCGHLATHLDVKRGLSEMASFQTLTRIPAEDAEKEKANNAKASPEANAEAAANFKAGEALDVNIEVPPASSTPDRRARLGRVTVSSTWEPGDPGPLLAFSQGWASRIHEE